MATKEKRKLRRYRLPVPDSTAPAEEAERAFFNPYHDEKGKFATKSGHAAALEGMSIPERKAAFAKMPQAERDRLADAPNSIAHEVGKLRSELGPADSVGERMRQVQDRIPPDSARLIGMRMTQMEGDLKDAGVDPKLARKITMDATDHMIAQEYESMARTLGDHGAHHLMQNAELTNELLALNPNSKLDSRARAMSSLTAVYHDTGYLTPQSKRFLDEDHPRWSQQYFDAKIRPDVEAAFGTGAGSLISRTIGTHSSTDMDWARDPFASSFRLSDNLALFHDEKMPAYVRYIPKNRQVLIRYGRGELDLATTRRQLMANVAGSRVDPLVRVQLRRAIGEVNPVTPKLTVGMFGATKERISWVAGHPVIHVRRGRANVALARVMDAGQKQFAKLAETFGLDPHNFGRSRRLIFRKRNRVLLEVRMRGEPLSLAERVRAYFNPHHDARGRFASSSAAGPAAGQIASGQTINEAMRALAIGIARERNPEGLGEVPNPSPLRAAMDDSELIASSADFHDFLRQSIPELTERQKFHQLHNETTAGFRQGVDEVDSVYRFPMDGMPETRLGTLPTLHSTGGALGETQMGVLRGGGLGARVLISPDMNETLGRVTAHHEIGHLSDLSLQISARRKAGLPDPKKLNFKDSYTSHSKEPDAVALMKTIKGTRAAADLRAQQRECRTALRGLSRRQQELADPMSRARLDFANYLLAPHELFARAHEQWMSLKKRNTPGGAKMARHHERLRHEFAGSFWSDEDFAPIAAAFDSFFRGRGLLREG